jgi:hypothetical protein
MTSLEVLDCVLEVLDDLGVEHMLVGAFSAVAYGVARATKDADFVVACEPRRVVEIAAALGADFALERQMELDTLTQSKRNVVTHLPSGFAIEFFFLNPDPHHQERFRRRRRGLISQGGPCCLAAHGGGRRHSEAPLAAGERHLRCPQRDRRVRRRPGLGIPAPLD